MARSRWLREVCGQSTDELFVACQGLSGKAVLVGPLPPAPLLDQVDEGRPWERGGDASGVGAELGGPLCEGGACGDASG